MPLWRLPNQLSDVLPPEARRLELLRRSALDTLRTWGYDLVTPPLLEQLGALTTGTAQDLDAVMFKTVDPAGGGLLGLRADLTPQVARIDAHLLNRQGVTRLCYCAPALRSTAADAFAQRELLQLGAELFGHAGIEADIEIQDLALHLLASLGIATPTLALSHGGVLDAVFTAHPALLSQQAAILAALRSKNRSDLSALCAAFDPRAASVLHQIATSYGTAASLSSLDFASYPAAAQALAVLRQLAARAELQGVRAVIDLADLQGFGYHTGVQFAVYLPGLASSMLRGGRYDAVGTVFGRARAATGFSFDARALARYRDEQAAERKPRLAVHAPWLPDDAALSKRIAELRAQGLVVVCSLGASSFEDGLSYTQALHLVQGEWVLQST